MTTQHQWKFTMECIGVIVGLELIAIGVTILCHLP